MNDRNLSVAEPGLAARFRPDHAAEDASTGFEFRYTRHQDCPQASRVHTKAPEGYLQWHDWADRKAKTHDCERCPHCGYWAVWKKKATA